MASIIVIFIRESSLDFFQESKQLYKYKNAETNGSR